MLAGGRWSFLSVCVCVEPRELFMANGREELRLRFGAKENEGKIQQERCRRIALGQQFNTPKYVTTAIH